jgi:uncharacterized membrane protein YecN with MAPEG domain
MTSLSSQTGRAGDDALGAALSFLGAPLRRCWLYAVWYVLICLGLACLWALRTARPIDVAPTALAYLLCCGVALFVPGILIGAISAAARLSPSRHRGLLDGYFIAAAALSVATILSGHLTATPVFILLVGNAILALDAQERASRRSHAAAPESSGSAT